MARPQRFTGAEPPLHVFQDEYHQNIHQQAPNKPRQPLQPTNQNAVLNPPHTHSANQSPFKTKAKMGGHAPRTPLKPKGASKLNMVQTLPPTSHPSVPSTDSLTEKQPPMSRFRTGYVPAEQFRAAHFAPNKICSPEDHDKVKYDNVSIYPAPPSNPMKAIGSFTFMDDKENAYQMPRPASRGLDIVDETYQTKAGGKRQLLDAAPIKEQRPLKKPKLDEGEIPAHDSFPPIDDDGEKPAISYANLIGMAILRSPQRKLTLSQIYRWISDTFRWYNLDDAGWQNSIRHNLSLNKAFIKQERPKNDPGKGHYWSIEAGKEHQFMGKEKSATRKPAVTAENLPVMSTRLEPQPSLSQPQSTPTLEPAQQFMPRPPSAHFPRPISRGPVQLQPQPNYQLLPPLPTSSARPTTAEMPQPSSDATILLASDSATIEDVQDILGRADEKDDEVNLYSPLPAVMHSSPPVPRQRHVDLIHGTTPPRPVSRHHGSSITNTRTHKRQFASMDDSGYISSLESSAMRPNAKGKMLTSEADRPRVKRRGGGGRAEEEIARLRAPSYDSPTKIRNYGGLPLSSSPPRHNSNEGQMLPPLTPATKLKAPLKPPPSASPGTNLLRHRQNVQNMIESPFRRASQLPKFDSATKLALAAVGPHLGIDESVYGWNTGPRQDLEDNFFRETEFNIWADLGTPTAAMTAYNLSPLKMFQGNGSPVKRSAKHPRLERPHSTSSLNGLRLGPHSMFPGVAKHSPASKMMAQEMASQSRKTMLPSSPLKLFQGNSFDAENVDPQDALACDGLGYGDEADGTDGTGPWFTLEDMCDTERLLEEDELEDDNGFDILGGFEKIGSGSQPLLQPPQQAQRPPRSPIHKHGAFGLARSYSTNF